MDNFNKVISFVLGLIVVIVFLAIISGRLNPKNKSPLLSFGSKPTATPTPQKQDENTDTSSKDGASVNKSTDSGGRYQTTPTTQSSNNVKSIPSTGPELLFPIAISSLLGGMFLRQTKK